MTTSLRSPLHQYLLARAAETVRIPRDRRERLASVASFVREARDRGGPARLVFVCTHNSRRSQLAQILAWALAAWHGHDDVSAHSAGTEVTAVASPVAATLRAAGFFCAGAADETNPVLEVRYAEAGPVLRVFSKPLGDRSLPETGFCAVMTCSEADANCPFVPGASARVSLPYEDPRTHDGSVQEAAAYARCCRDIARELCFLFASL